MGYEWLPEDEVFPFYELRAAAVSLHNASEFSESETRARIQAQLETLHDNKIRHAVLSAFGCGAFRNPADKVAKIYLEELRARPGMFDCIAFAIFNAGYGPDNFQIFNEVFASYAVTDEVLMGELDTCSA
jgi:uncharacterized protein (TIGR02452 family)